MQQKKTIKDLFRGSKQHQIVHKKHTVGPAALVDSAVTVYPMNIDYEEEW